MQIYLLMPMLSEKSLIDKSRLIVFALAFNTLSFLCVAIKQLLLLFFVLIHIDTCLHLFEICDLLHVFRNVVSYVKTHLQFGKNHQFCIWKSLNGTALVQMIAALYKLVLKYPSSNFISRFLKEKKSHASRSVVQVWKRNIFKTNRKGGQMYFEIKTTNARAKEGRRREKEK